MASGLLRRAVKSAAAAVDTLRRPDRGLVVLPYHRVGAGSGLDIDLDAGLFDCQMEELAERRVVTLDDGLKAVQRSATDAPDPVAVTFDDGTADFADIALPILVRHQVPVTIYLATRFVDEDIDFPAGGHPLSWAALDGCVATGLVAVGSHTHSHALLDQLPDDLVEAELERSVELLREHLGVDAAHFAYPKAVDGSTAARAAIRLRFRLAAVAGTRPNPYGRTDLQHVARSPVQESDGMHWFRRSRRRHGCRGRAATPRQSLALQGGHQVSAAALPMIGSTVGVNATVLEHFGMPACTSGDEWVDALLQLIGESRAARSQAGARARAAAVARYSFLAWQEDWLEAVGLSPLSVLSSER
jgi:peptidoglycan/xylan/chitin deacetylase (PgdA/CDA1 family)